MSARKVLACVATLCIVLNQQGIVNASDDDATENTPITETSRDQSVPLHLAPGIVELTDESFEHSTQASTGQTTGSWLVWFHSDVEDDGAPLIAGEAPGTEKWLEHSIILASVRVSSSGGQKVVNRFDLKDLPALLYIHKGSYYRLSLDHSPKWSSIYEFCLAPDPALALDVPAAPTVWSDLQTKLKSDPNHTLVLGGVVLALILGLFVWSATNHFGSKGKPDESRKNKKD